MSATTDAASLRPLWTDAPDAMNELDRLSAFGAVPPALRAPLAHFIEHGWLILPGAIEPSLIDRFVDDIHTLHRHPGMFVRTDHRNGGAALQVVGSTPDRFESLLDLYANLESSRRVCMHPCITQFLVAVFRARPLAFQQLLFQRSNSHQFHQDTAYVAVEEPLFLVATWIALEDVVEGSGEFAYYDASHRLPHILFANGTKRFDFARDDQKAYARKLDEMCRDRKLDVPALHGEEGRRAVLGRRAGASQPSAGITRRDQPPVLCHPLLSGHSASVLVPLPSGQSRHRAGQRWCRRVRELLLSPAA